MKVQVNLCQKPNHLSVHDLSNGEVGIIVEHSNGPIYIGSAVVKAGDRVAYLRQGGGWDYCTLLGPTIKVRRLLPNENVVISGE